MMPKIMLRADRRDEDEEGHVEDDEEPEPTERVLRWMTHHLLCKQ